MTYTGMTEGLAVCGNCGKDVHTPAGLQACINSIVGPVIAYGRAEDEPCERGTVGCCVNHSAPHQPRSDTCEPW